MQLLPTYEMAENPPACISPDDYARQLVNEYQGMLADESLQESDFQGFFERNPCMLPGFTMGNPSHGAHFQAVVSQPVIDGCVQRRPDFMWLLETSLELIPVFIEIERPSKNMFRQSSDIQNVKFTQASDQILEWKALLEEPKARGDFYERYRVSDRLRSCVFSPRFILVYGRRREYQGEDFLTRKRSKIQDSGLTLMSFDRLTPSYDAMNYATVKIDSSGTVQVIDIPPTFRLGPSIADEIANWTRLSEAVASNGQIPIERREFLIRRFEYWRNWAHSDDRGAFEDGLLE